jgi:hypothetical protein
MARANLTFETSDVTPQVQDFVDRSREPLAASSRSTTTSRMTAQDGGRFSLDVPVGARLCFADVCGAPAMLDGPRTKQNAAARFRPLHRALDRQVSEGMTEIALEVEEGGQLAGIVRDEKSGAPIAGARITTQTLTGNRIFARSEADGRFCIGETGPNLRLHLEHEGYASFDVTLRSEQFAPGAPEVVLLLEHTLRVSGKVVDARGEPVVGLDLELDARGAGRPGRGDRTNAWFTCTTTADGSFVFDQLPACEDVAITHGYSFGEPNGFVIAPRALGPLLEDIEGLVLVSMDSTTISVHVTLPDGRVVLPDEFHLECEEPHLMESVIADHVDRDFILRVPVGVELHLLVLGHEKPGDTGRLLRGVCNVRIDRVQAEPQEVRIELKEALDFTPPPAPEGVQSIDLYRSAIPVTVDVRLLDREGKPLRAIDDPVLYYGTQIGDLAPADGWVRLRASPGVHMLELKLGEQRDQFELRFPSTGYAKVEQQLRIGP